MKLPKARPRKNIVEWVEKDGYHDFRVRGLNYGSVWFHDDEWNVEADFGRHYASVATGNFEDAKQYLEEFIVECASKNDQIDEQHSAKLILEWWEKKRAK